LNKLTKKKAKMQDPPQRLSTIGRPPHLKKTPKRVHFFPLSDGGREQPGSYASSILPERGGKGGIKNVTRIFRVPVTKRVSAKGGGKKGFCFRGVIFPKGKLWGGETCWKPPSKLTGSQVRICRCRGRAALATVVSGQKVWGRIYISETSKEKKRFRQSPCRKLWRRRKKFKKKCIMRRRQGNVGPWDEQKGRAPELLRKRERTPGDASNKQGKMGKTNPAGL